METLYSLVNDILEKDGAVVEKVDDSLMEVILPDSLSKTLNLPEYLVFAFNDKSAELADQVITYDSDIINKFADIVNKRGTFSQWTAPDLYLKTDKMGEILQKKLILNNATYRLNGFEEKVVSYLLLNYKYTAISDEKKDKLISIVVNELTLSTLDDFTNRINLFDKSESEGFSALKTEERLPIRNILYAGNHGIKSRIKRELYDFEKSMNRRLQRDINRLESYYSLLKKEVEKKIAKKGLIGEEKKRELLRIKAIDVEHKKKILDQIDKYSIKIECELISALRIVIPSVVLKVIVYRKKENKGVLLCWNPVLKELEKISCESCYYHSSSHFVCNSLHILCPDCYIKCSSCEKWTCRVCDSEKCIRCGLPLFPL